MGPLIHVFTCSKLDAVLLVAGQGNRGESAPKEIKKPKVMFGAAHFQERVCYRDVCGRPTSGRVLLKLCGFVPCILKSRLHDLPVSVQ